MEKKAGYIYIYIYICKYIYIFLFGKGRRNVSDFKDCRPNEECRSKMKRGAGGNKG